MSTSLNIKIIQANFTAGAIDNNLKKIITIYQQTTQIINCPDLIVFSELSITGYQAEDLYLQENFQNQAIEAIESLKLVTENSSCAILLGNLAKNEQGEIINAGYLISNGEVIEIRAKNKLANHGVFDDKRYFKSGEVNHPFLFKGYKIGLLICEDIWFVENTDALCKQGVDILITINASPFHINKDKQRKQIAKDICLKHQVDLVYVNQVCGQDEIIFDGGSFAYNRFGEIVVQLSYFKEDQANIAWNNKNIEKNKMAAVPSQMESIYQALMLGLVDYVQKNGFDKVLFGLSGGIDSALTAAIAVDALGSDKVLAVMLPSKYTSRLSINDAEACAKNLNIELLNISIEEIAQATRNSFKDLSSLADQNIQARTRGLLLMTMSNQFGHLLLSTGNKSENSVGYATLYGDMCGGYNLLKDLYKTQVYQLVSWRNKQSLVIPESIINKAPTAELHFNQKDQDSLPDYELLDQILFYFIEENLSIKNVVDKGYDEELVEKIFKMLKGSEYKRKQSCLGPIISPCSLSRDRRYPVTNHFNNN